MARRDPFFAARADAPYFATVFSWKSNVSAETLERFFAEIYQEIATAPGFIGIERSTDGGDVGIAVSYWETRPAAMAWLHAVRTLYEAQDEWRASRVFKDFSLRIVKVEQSIDMADAGKAPPFR